MDGMASESKPSGSFYTPLLISLAGIVATSLAIAAYHLILVRFCLRRGRRNRHLQPAEMFTGVARKVLDKIPILSYSTGNVSGDQMFREDQSECAVCIGELEDGEMVRLLPNCRHAFHVTCIDKWFLAHSNCPICRSPVADAAPTTFAIAKPLPDAVDQGLQVPQRLTSLKRSFSMGQSYIIVNIQGEGEKAFSASSSSSSCSIEDGLMQSGSQRVQSVRQLDRMSLRLLRSFSQLRLGRGGGCTAKGILPY